MALYHPPKMITNNAAPAITADLAYEGHGKCGTTWVIANVRDFNVFNSIDTPSGVNGWKVVFVHDTKVIGFRANNMDSAQSDLLGTAVVPKIHPAGSEIMADISFIQIDDRAVTGLAIIYRDCSQS